MYEIQEFTVKPDKYRELSVKLTVKVKFTVNFQYYANRESCKIASYFKQCKFKFMRKNMSKFSSVMSSTRHVPLVIPY